MNKTFAFLLASILAFTFTSCKKEQGCMDSQAENYSNAAEEDDGSCTYTGRAFVYYSYTASNNFEDDFITDLNIYMNDQLAGTMEADASINSITSCYSNDHVSRTFDLGSSKTKNYLLRVENQANGNILYATEFQVIAGNDCNAVEIMY